MFRRRSGERLVDKFWALDMASFEANVAWWRAGSPDANGAHWQAALLDRSVGRADGRVHRRAGALAVVPLNALVDLPESGAVRAAAAVRVIDTDVFLADGEQIQPGVELPEEGWWVGR